MRRVMIFDHRARIRRRGIKNDDRTRRSPVTAIDTETASVKSGILYDRDEAARERYPRGAF